MSWPLADAVFDGPIPPAEWAASRWEPGAHARLAQGADEALLEALFAGARRAAAWLRAVPAGAADRQKHLARAMSAYRQGALAARQRRRG